MIWSCPAIAAVLFFLFVKNAENIDNPIIAVVIQIYLC